MEHGELRITVLIVDDHRSFAEALALALGKEEDLEVLPVTVDGVGAAKAAAAHRPNVALVDLQMPGIDGFETSRRIKASSPGTTVIIITGTDDELALGRSIQAGAHGLLRKTIAIQELTDAVRKAGGTARFLLLPEAGIKGNSHMMMMDKNNLVVADQIIAWLGEATGKK